MQWRIKLINVGQEKICTSKCIAGTKLHYIEKYAVILCKKYLRSRDVEITHVQADCYDVFASLYKVGEVKITKLKKDEEVTT